MEERAKDLQCGIIQDLNEIDKLCSVAEFRPSDVAQLYDKYIQTIAWIDDHIKSIENETAVQLLEFLKHFFDVR